MPEASHLLQTAICLPRTGYGVILEAWITTLKELVLRNFGVPIPMAATEDSAASVARKEVKSEDQSFLVNAEDNEPREARA